MDPLHETTLVLVAFAISLLAYRFVLLPAFFSPLAKVPVAHWSASISPVWILYVRFRRRENKTLHEAHKRLGPVVRVAPNELSIDDIHDVRTVYQGGFEKPEWYSVFDNYGVPCMFSTRPSKEHSLRKRMTSHVYSKSYIQGSKAAEAQARIILFDRLLPLIDAPASGRQGGTTIDVHSTFMAAAMDFISAYVFGICDSTNFLQKAAYRDHWLKLYMSRHDYPFFNQELPRTTPFFKRIGVHLFPQWVDAANQELRDWNQGICQAAMRSTAEARPDLLGTAGEPVVMRALLSGMEKEKGKTGRGTYSPLYPHIVLKHDLSVASELMDHVLAGQETSGLALTYLTWHLSKDQELQRRLRADLLALNPNLKVKPGDSNGSLPGQKALDSVPLLHHVLLETLRLHAPIPGPQPRETPASGCRIGQYQIPGGVRIAALAHTLHRNERVFPDPEKWDPTRWEGASEEDDDDAASGDDSGDGHARRERFKHFWAFSSGGRMCIGSNFAMHEMKLIIAAIYTNFTTQVVDDEGIEQGDGYTGRPSSERLYICFERNSR